MPAYSKTLLFGSLILIAFLTSCKKDNKIPIDIFEKFIYDNNTIMKKINGYKIKVRLEPTDLLVLRELRDQEYSKNNFEQNRVKFQDFTYFNIQIEADKDNRNVLLHNVNTEEQYYTNLDFYTNHMKEFFYIESLNSRLTPSFYHFEKNLGTQGTVNFVVAFPKNKVTASKEILFTCEVPPIQSGRLKFRFNNTQSEYSVDIN